MTDGLISLLLDRGCSQEQASRLSGHFDRLGPGTVRLFVPGRIELVGNHVDYAGGSSLTMATSRGLAVVADPIAESVLRVEVASQGLAADFPLETSIRGEGWATYPATLIRRIMGNIPSASGRGGAHIRIFSDLPLASGLSSSSAFLIALFLGWGHAAEWIEDPLLQDHLPDDQALADYVATIENGRDFGALKGRLGVGTAGGSQDHTAIVRSRAGHIGRYRYINPRREGLWAWPEGIWPLVLVSGVVAEKAGAALEDYNAAVELARGLLEAWNATGQSVAGIGLLSDADLALLGERVSGQLGRRLAAFRAERVAVNSAADALEAGDLGAFATSVNRSQETKETLLQNQIPETVTLCKLAREHGALAATSFGAGFGGAVLALMPVGSEDRTGSILSAYEARHNQTGAALLEQPGPGAFLLEGGSLRG